MISLKSPYILSLLINILVLILFFKNINCSIQSYNQTGNRIDIQLIEPLFKINITSLGNPLYENAVSTLNSCLFNTSTISIDLTKFKGVVNYIKNTGYDDFVFTLCGAVKPHTQSYSGFDSYGRPETETFKLGRYGIDDYALKLSYSSFEELPYTSLTITFYCSDEDDFKILKKFPPNVGQSHYNISIDSRHVCPYRNVKLMKSNYYLTQPNIASILLDENSTSTFFFNNGYSIENTSTKYLDPIVYSIENDDNQIVVNGFFFVNMKSQYQIYIDGLILDIISINSTTALLNCTNFMDNRFLVRLGEDYPFGESGPFSFSKSTNNFNVSLMMQYQYNKYETILECSGCIGSILEGIIGYNNDSIFINDKSLSIVNENNRYIEQRGVYLRSLYPPYKTSNIIWNPPSSIETFDIKNENFQFSGGKQTIQGYFITPSIINGKLSFLNGTDVILKYQVLNNFIKTQGTFIIPPGYGSGNFSIYLNDQLVNSTLFSYVPPTSSWIKSMKQDKEKIQLTLIFDLNPDFNITNIKYSNGHPLDYHIINQNIIQFNLSSYSTNQITFNDNTHGETLKNFEPFIYNYSIIENDIVEINGLFLSKDLTYYNFSMGTFLIDQMNRILYFDNYKIKINIKYYSENNLILTLYGSNISIPIVDRNQDTMVYMEGSSDYYYIYCNNNCAGIKVQGIKIYKIGSNDEFSTFQFSLDNLNSGIFSIGLSYSDSIEVNADSWITYSTPLNNNAIFLPLPPPTFIHLYSQDGLYSMTNFEDYEFEVGGNFLYTTYNNSQYCKMSFNFVNGTVYEFSGENLVSKSGSVKRYYILKVPYANGDGNFTVNYFDNANNYILLKSIPFKYPVGLLVVHSISNVEPNLPNSKLSIIADGIFSLPLIQLKIGSNGDIFNCDNITAIGLSSKGTIVNCNFNSTSLTTPEQFNQKIYITINNGQDHNLETSFSQCLTCINTDSSNSIIDTSNSLIDTSNSMIGSSSKTDSSNSKNNSSNSYINSNSYIDSSDNKINSSDKIIIMNYLLLQLIIIFTIIN
ncbi:hypothetical protein ACTA71_010022 [Dictyostelium dimigraforme]